MSEKKKTHFTNSILPRHGDKYYETFTTLPISARVHSNYTPKNKTTKELTSRNSAFDAFTKKAGSIRRKKTRKLRKLRKKINFL